MLQQLARVLRRGLRQRRLQQRAKPARRLALETLEERCLPALCTSLLSAPAALMTNATATTVKPGANVHVSTTSPTATLNAGSQARFMIAVSNGGTVAATGLTLSDPLPGGVAGDLDWQIDPGRGDPSDFAISGAVGSQTLILSPTIATLAPGHSIRVYLAALTGFADAPAPLFKGSLSNTATVNATNEASTLQNQSATAVITVLTPDVTISNKADQSSINAGTAAGFTVTLKNIGTGSATGISVSDALPRGLGGDVAWSIDAKAGNATDFQIKHNVLAVKGGSSLAPGKSLSVHVVGKTSFADVSATTFSGTLPSTATVSAGNEAPALQNQAASAGITVTAPDVTVSTTPDQATIVAGSPAGFTVSLANAGTATAKRVAFYDPLPRGLAKDVTWSIDTSAGNPTDFQIKKGALVLKGISTLTAGQSIAVHVVGATSVRDGGSVVAGILQNKATVTAANEAPALRNQVATATVTLGAPDVIISNSADQATIDAGSVAGFTVTVKNAGTATATGLTFSDPLPGGLGKDITWKIDTRIGNPADFIISSNALSFNGLNSLTAGTTITVHVTGMTTFTDVDAQTLEGMLSSTAQVNAGNEAVSLQNQAAGATVTVITPDLTLANVPDHQATVLSGDPAGFTITVKNIGTDAGTGISFSDPLPAGLGNDLVWSIDSATGNPADFLISGGTLVLNGINSLAPGQSISVHITARTSANDVDATSYYGALTTTPTLSASNEPESIQNRTLPATVFVVVPDPDQSVVTVSLPAGNGTALVSLQPEDAFGNNLTAPNLSVTFAVGAGTGKGVFSAVTYNPKDGTYNATFTGTTAGTITIVATLNGQSLSTLPNLPLAGSYRGTYTGAILHSDTGDTENVNGDVKFTIDSGGNISVSDPGPGQGSVDTTGDAQPITGAGVIGTFPTSNYTFSGPHDSDGNPTDVFFQLYVTPQGSTSIMASGEWTVSGDGGFGPPQLFGSGFTVNTWTVTLS